jgi:hypothetical protein
MFFQLLSFILTGIIFAFLIPVLLHAFFALGPGGFIVLAIVVCFIGGLIWG